MTNAVFYSEKDGSCHSKKLKITAQQDKLLHPFEKDGNFALVNFGRVG